MDLSLFRLTPASLIDFVPLHNAERTPLWSINRRGRPRALQPTPVACSSWILGISPRSFVDCNQHINAGSAIVSVIKTTLQPITLTFDLFQMSNREPVYSLAGALFHSEHRPARPWSTSQITSLKEFRVTFSVQSTTLNYYVIAKTREVITDMSEWALRARLPLPSGQRVEPTVSGLLTCCLYVNMSETTYLSNAAIKNKERTGLVALWGTCKYYVSY